ncbi:endonuclease/exonuclease/phosphatase family protein [Kribbella sp. NPDC004536]|uniref:endonuclease/exonuclease/phosphatase family protein n=1 Tax=Kribbella sp. NPDC004536 TaxID=3364106 RepID=UPI003691E484
MKIRPGIRVASFNIRNSSAPDGDNAWPVRRKATVAAIEQLDADVVGLQEVLPDQLEYLRWRFGKYEIVGAGRDDGMSAGEHSPVLVRPGDWRIERYETRWLSDDPGTPGSIGWDADLTRIATLAWLRHRNGTTIGVVNTHYDHAGEVAQLQSSRLIARWISGSLPWIVLGDLNATPDSPPVKTLVDAGLRLAVPLSEGGSWHDFTGAVDGDRIDHLLVTPEWTVTDASVSHHRPEGHLPSDHWPIVATLSM